MDQKTIIEALQKALAGGTGSLDDLYNLLEHAQEDIAEAKAAEEKAKEEAERKRAQYGVKVAEMANRMIDGKLTDDDCAMVLNAWFKSHGVQNAGFTGDQLKEIFNVGEKQAKDLAEFAKEIDKVIDSLNKNWKVKATPKTEKKKETDPNDVIDNFLKSFGLR